MILNVWQSFLVFLKNLFLPRKTISFFMGEYGVVALVRINGNITASLFFHFDQSAEITTLLKSHPSYKIQIILTPSDILIQHYPIPIFRGIFKFWHRWQYMDGNRHLTDARYQGKISTLEKDMISNYFFNLSLEQTQFLKRICEESNGVWDKITCVHLDALTVKSMDNSSIFLSCYYFKTAGLWIHAVDDNDIIYNKMLPISSKDDLLIEGHINEACHILKQKTPGQSIHKTCYFELNSSVEIQKIPLDVENFEPESEVLKRLFICQKSNFFTFLPIQDKLKKDNHIKSLYFSLSILSFVFFFIFMGMGGFGLHSFYEDEKTQEQIQRYQNDIANLKKALPEKVIDANQLTQLKNDVEKNNTQISPLKIAYVLSQCLDPSEHLSLFYWNHSVPVKKKNIPVDTWFTEAHLSMLYDGKPQTRNFSLRNCLKQHLVDTKISLSKKNTGINIKMYGDVHDQK